MRVRDLLAAAIVASALAGCSATSMPDSSAVPGPTLADVEVAHDRVLEATWLSMDVSTTRDRPLVEPGEPLDDTAWRKRLYDCMLSAEYTLLQSGGGGGTYSFSLADAAMNHDPEVQLQFYLCAAAHPKEPGPYNVVYSQAQIDYFYEHYKSWLIPCLVQNQYELETVPSKQEFTAGGGLWSPFDQAAVSTGASAHKAMIELCGEERPGIDSDSQ